MRFAVSSYSFSRYLRDGRLDLFGAIAKTAELGFEGIEINLDDGSGEVIKRCAPGSGAENYTAPAVIAATKPIREGYDG